MVNRQVLIKKDDGSSGDKDGSFASLKLSLLLKIIIDMAHLNILMVFSNKKCSIMSEVICKKHTTFKTIIHFWIGF